MEILKRGFQIYMRGCLVYEVLMEAARFCSWTRAPASQPFSMRRPRFWDSFNVTCRLHRFLRYFRQIELYRSLNVHKFPPQHLTTTTVLTTRNARLGRHSIREPSSFSSPGKSFTVLSMLSDAHLPNHLLLMLATTLVEVHSMTGHRC